MDKKHGIGSLALIALVAGALFRPAAGERPAAAESGVAGVHDSAPDNPSSRIRPDDDDQADTLDLLADSLGVDTSTEGLIRRARRSLKTLSDGTDSKARADAAKYLQAFLALEIRKDAPGLTEARGAADRLTADVARSSDLRTDIKPVRQFLERYFNRDALHVEHPSDRDKLLAEDFEQVEKTSLKLFLIRQVASDEPETLIRFLIATLPDPIDSFTGWQFDPMLDAITQAISESDYIFDRFYFPDTGRARGSAAENGRIHEDQPSLVIFRRHINSAEREKERRERLVLLIVHENPSAGVHDGALARAIRLVERWDGPGQEDTVRILGPTFSGSSDSMVRAIKQTRKSTEDHCKQIWIVSGSATDPENKRTLQGSLEKGRVSFQATVQADDVLLATLMRHVNELGWSTPIALLSEGNTQYGRQMVELTEQLTRENHIPVVRLTFPMNISRLRATAPTDKAALPNVLGLPSRFRPLAMEQDGNPEDQLPQYTPRTSASHMELALSDLLQTLRREHVRTVALMATDPRDKLYLAQQIAHDSPDVTIMTAESDSLYGHPDYSSFLQGAIVASTYPLFAGNQRWSYGFQGNSQRRLFANGSSEGIYNAALALLNYSSDGNLRKDEDGASVVDPETAPRLVEYSQPVKQSSDDGPYAGAWLPPVWISVIGRGGAWPVRAYPAPPCDPYVFRVSLDAAVRQDSLTAFPSPLFIATCIVLVSLTLVAWSGARTRLPRLMVEHPDIAPAVNRPLGGLRYVLVCILSVSVIDAFVTAVLLARFRIERTVWSGAAVVASVGSLVLLADLTRWALAYGLKRTGIRGAMWRGAAIGLIALWAIGSLLLYPYPFFAYAGFGGQPSVDAVGFVTRATNFGSGVNPTLPVLFIMAALALWSIAELKRASTPDVALTDPEVHRVILRTITGTLDKMSPRWIFFNRSIVAVPPALAVVMACAVAGVCMFAFDPVVAPLVTSEGRRFGQFVSTGLLVTETLIGLSILQLIYLWWSLKQLLDRMAWHPTVDAFQRVPPELFPPAVFPKIPRLIELQFAVTRWQEHVSALAPGSFSSARIPAECRDIDAVFRDDMGVAPNQHWSASQTWKRLVTALARPAIDPAFAGMGISDLDWTEPADPLEHELVAIAMALVIRDAIARLGGNLIFITVGMLLVFCAHTLFPFQLRTELAALDWAFIGLTFVAIVVVIAQMKRNAIIARMSSATSAERTTWDWEFALKLVIFCLVPLLTLFATQFPEIGATVLSWLEPVEKALP